MEITPNGTIPIVHLPGTGSLLSRTKEAFKQTWRTAMPLSLGISGIALVNFGITSLLNYLVKDSGHNLQAVTEVVNSAITLGAQFLYAWLFAALILTIKGRETTVQIKEAIERARGVALSLFWVFILISLALYGGIVTLIAPVLFSVWFYFAIYLAAMGEAKGANALAMSRYLARGLWWQVLGRSLASVFFFGLLILIAFAALAIPTIGWIVTVVLMILITIFAVPLQAIYDVLRLEDLAAIPRSVGYMSFSGELNAIRTWAIFGGLIFGIGWGFSLLDCTMRTQVAQVVVGGVGIVVQKVDPIMQGNRTILDDLFKKISYQYNPQCTLGADSGGLLPSDTSGTDQNYDYNAPDSSAPVDFQLDNGTGGTPVAPEPAPAAGTTTVTPPVKAPVTPASPKK